MKSYTQNVYTFVNGETFVVNSKNSGVTVNGDYISKDAARRLFKRLLVTGLTYQTDTSIQQMVDWDQVQEPTEFWDRYQNNWELNYGNS